MKGVYVFWTNRDDKIMTDYTAITGILSMLYWRKNNGPIKLIVDDKSLIFFKRYGFLDLGIIDEIDTSLLTSEKAAGIKNKDCHWTWANIFTINDLKEDCVLIDWDNIYKQKFVPEKGIDLTYAHREEIEYPYYPHPKMHIHDYENSEFKKFDWTGDFAFNASFLHFANLELAEEYAHYAMKYITHPQHQAKRNFDYLNVRIVFVDQMLLAEVAKFRKTKYIFNDIFTPNDQGIWKTEGIEKSNRDDNLMYHLWIFKKRLHVERHTYEKYMKDSLKELKDNFPEYYDKTMDILFPLSLWKTTREYDFQKARQARHDSGEYIKYV